MTPALHLSKTFLFWTTLASWPTPIKSTLSNWINWSVVLHCEYIPNESLMRSLIPDSPGRALIPSQVHSNKTQRGHIYAVFCLSLSLRPVTRLHQSVNSPVCSPLATVNTVHLALRISGNWGAMPYITLLHYNMPYITLYINLIPSHNIRGWHRLFLHRVHPWR